MRAISISTDVFAKLWAGRELGEESEDDILRRILECPATSSIDCGLEKPQGVYDARNKVNFPEGFEIFRTYKHVEYQATATEGQWVLNNTNQGYPNLNQLTDAVSDGNENAWVSWNYLDATGIERKVSTRRPSKAQPSLKELWDLKQEKKTESLNRIVKTVLRKDSDT